MRRSTLIAAITAALALSGCGPEEQPLSSGASVGIAHRVTVLSGDAIVVDRQHYRLANGFAPEVTPQARCWAEAVAARQVTNYVQQLVKSAADIEVTPTGGRDEYNRQYALISLDGLDLGQTLFEEGLVARPPKGRFAWCHAISENDAGAPDVFVMMRAPPR